MPKFMNCKWRIATRYGSYYTLNILFYDSKNVKKNTCAKNNKIKKNKMTLVFPTKEIFCKKHHLVFFFLFTSLRKSRKA